MAVIAFIRAANAAVTAAVELKSALGTNTVVVCCVGLERVKAIPWTILPVASVLEVSRHVGIVHPAGNVADSPAAATLTSPP
jgi:hypothetical protein